jgi:2-polyprenyl-6-methoxyphenol hydroxylase-like FAD-dependent oxidoreductase
MQGIQAHEAEPETIRVTPAARRAVVIGAGMGGMLAARALSDSFDEVVIVERDRLDAGAATRKGVPQAQHLHGLLKRGELILDDLFPGLVASLCDKGAQRLTLGRDMAWFHGHHWKTTCPKGIVATILTRPFLEAEGGGRVVGLTHRSGQDGPEAFLRADLVVDSAGRGTRAPAWLAALGYDAPEMSFVGVHVGYSTCVFERPKTWTMPWKALMVAPGNSTRMAALMPIEGGRLMASAAGLLRDYPPGDLRGLLEFVRSLPVDGIHRAIEHLTPTGEVVTTRFPGNHWVHYEKMPRFPDGLVILGDAVGCYNPLYGQGMTLAAIQVEILREALRKARRADLAGFSRSFQRKAADAVAGAWQMSTSEDFRFEAVEGKRPPGYEQMRWYLDQIQAATSIDPVVYERFLQVMHMLAPFPTLLAPSFAIRVLRAARAARRRDAAARLDRRAPSPSALAPV